MRWPVVGLASVDSRVAIGDGCFNRFFSSHPLVLSGMKVMDVKATRVSGFDECKNPGDFFFTEPNEAEGGARRLSFLCPCGCGDLCGIRVNDDGSQEHYAWSWNLDKDKPTTHPSININNGHWHGYLTDGVFKRC